MIFERLRLETHDLHQQMERQLPIFSGQFALGDYKKLLERYEGFYLPVEDKLIALRSRGLAVFDTTREKLPFLRLDLQRLGSGGNGSICQAIPALESVSQGIGCMYVLEGSTLGGQVILRHLHQTLGITPENGGAFFASYGSELGKRWKEFRELVRADDRSRTEADQIVASARATFRCFQAWLTSEL
jgi:heme oxygenase